MSEDTTTAAVKAALDRYTDPNLGDTLGAAQAVRSVEPPQRGVLVRLYSGLSHWWAWRWLCQ